MTAGPGAYLDPAASALVAAAATPRCALFLDRDGVINEDRAYVHTQEDTHWLPGIVDLCRGAHAAGWLLVVVTNQAGIARGYYSEADFLAYTAWVHAEFERLQAPLLATYYCPHHPQAGIGALRVACGCRKPEPGMIQAAVQAHGIVASASVLLGNKESDVLAGLAAGVGTCLLLDPAATAGPATGGAHCIRDVAEASAFLGGRLPHIEGRTA
jgi:D-glycero-D-manno-heptose 1,7-bisphosphate phosphatase